MTVLPVIYMALCRETNKAYVGKTVCFLTRQRRHISSALSGRSPHPKFCRALRKHGVASFSWSILQECESSKALDEAERFWIEKYDTVNNGYNCATGGSGLGVGFKFSKESKEKMSVSAKIRGSNRIGKKHSEHTKLLISSLKIGKRMAPTVRKKMSASHTGLRLSPQTRAKVGASKLGRVLNKETRKFEYPLNPGSVG